MGQTKNPPKFPHLGRRIREARDDQRLMQADLAEALGVDSNHISRIERGRVNPPRKARIVLQELLKKPASYFVNEWLDAWGPRPKETVVELDQSDVYPNRAALRRRKEWDKASDAARAHVNSVAGLRGDYTVNEWLEELRTIDRMFKRGVRIDVTTDALGREAEVDVVDDEDG